MWSLAGAGIDYAIRNKHHISDAAGQAADSVSGALAGDPSRPQGPAPIPQGLEQGLMRMSEVEGMQPGNEQGVAVGPDGLPLDVDPRVTNQYADRRSNLVATTGLEQLYGKTASFRGTIGMSGNAPANGSAEPFLVALTASALLGARADLSKMAGSLELPGGASAVDQPNLPPQAPGGRQLSNARIPDRMTKAKAARMVTGAVS